jgi:hypothetical protein
MEEKARVKVTFKIEDGGARFSDILAAERVGEDLYRLLHPPCGAWWLSVGDVVRCRPATEEEVFRDGPHVVYEELVESAGHQTVSVVFRFEDDFDTYERITLEMKEAGFRVFEAWGRERLVDIESKEELDRLMAFLEQRRGHLDRVEVLGPPKGGMQ